MMEPLKIARYRFSFRVTELMRLPEYAGSTLRGAFGHALRQVNCVTHAKECKGCPLIAQCPYAQVFAPHDIPRAEMALNIQQQIPVPYSIEAPLLAARTYHEGDEMYFDMVLLGSAIEHLAVIILAWRRAFLRGIGNGDGKGELIRVEQWLDAKKQNANIIYTEDAPVIKAHEAQLLLSEYQQSQPVHIKLLTPLRLQHRGEMIGYKTFTAAIFLRHLIRRVSTVWQAQGSAFFTKDIIHQLNTLADAVESEQRVQWVDWGRYSSRQKQAMNLGGLVGRVFLHNVPVELLSIIEAGLWLHLGKETSFGLGAYEWVSDDWVSDRVALPNTFM